MLKLKYYFFEIYVKIIFIIYIIYKCTSFKRFARVLHREIVKQWNQKLLLQLFGPLAFIKKKESYLIDN